jgi:hypothetical protein
MIELRLHRIRLNWLVARLDLVKSDMGLPGRRPNSIDYRFVVELARACINVATGNRCSLAWQVGADSTSASRTLLPGRI